MVVHPADRPGDLGRASNVHQLPVGSRPGDDGRRRHPSDPSFDPEDALRDHDYYSTTDDDNNCACSHHYDYHTAHNDNRCSYHYNVPGDSARCGCPKFRRA